MIPEILLARRILQELENKRGCRACIGRTPELGILDFLFFRIRLSVCYCIYIYIYPFPGGIVAKFWVKLQVFLKSNESVFK